MAPSAYLNQVQQLYIAYFGRPADPNGLYYWANAIDAAKGDASAVLLGFATAPESQVLYGNMSNPQKIAAIYQNLFARDPEPAGLALWTGLLDSNKLSSSQAAWAILNSAGPGDDAAVNNKVTFANAFTTNVDTAAEIAAYSGTVAAAAAHAFLAKVDSSPQFNVSARAISAVAVVTGIAAPTIDDFFTTPPPPFTAMKDGSNAVTFANAGAAISVALAGGTYTFTSGTVNSAVTGTVSSVTIPAATTLTASSTLASGINFLGTGTLALSDTGAVTSTVLKNIEAATSGLVDASTVTSITGASSADAQLLLVTNNGSSGNKIKTAANVAVTLTDTTTTGTVLKAIDDATTGVVDASTVTSLTASTVAQAKQLLVTNVAAVTHAAGVTVALTDASAAAVDLNGIDAATTGLVTASSLTSVTGAVADVKTTLEAFTLGTTLSASSLASVNLTDAISTSSLNNVIFANNATMTLANVSGNTLTLIDATIASGKSLTIDGSAVTSAVTLNASAETNGTVTLYGGSAADTLTGGAGGDVMTGNGGIDNFVFNAANRSTLAFMDTIMDYRAAGGGNAGAADINHHQRHQHGRL